MLVLVYSSWHKTSQIYPFNVHEVYKTLDECWQNVFPLYLYLQIIYLAKSLLVLFKSKCLSRSTHLCSYLWEHSNLLTLKGSSLAITRVGLDSVNFKLETALMSHRANKATNIFAIFKVRSCPKHFRLLFCGCWLNGPPKAKKFSLMCFWLPVVENWYGHRTAFGLRWVP